MNAAVAPVGGLAVRSGSRAVPAVHPVAAYRALAGGFGQDQVFLLESCGGNGPDSSLHVVGFGVVLELSVSDGVVTARSRHPGVEAALAERLSPLLRPGPVGSLGRLPDRRDLWTLLRALNSLMGGQGSATGFRCGFLAYFGYDTARYMEDLPYLISGDGALPDVHLVFPEGHLLLDAGGAAGELVVQHSSAWPAPDPARLVELLAAAEPVPEPGPPAEHEVSDETHELSFAADVSRCLEHIAVGDIYQVQIGHELTIDSPLAPFDVYLRLRRRNPSPFMYLSHLAGHTVVGASPELFVRFDGETVTMRPIAGTSPRGGSWGDDEEIGRRLRSDPKERAEHVMLVDLCRNDISRICAPNSLEVPQRIAVERYSHVLHLVSTVTGRIDGTSDVFDVVRATFPAGTMTGAPKVRAMEIIESVEASRRGLYAGAIGLLDVGGHLNLALVIRTLVHDGRRYRTRASAGVVADSRADREWTETLAKLNAGHWAVTGAELV